MTLTGDVSNLKKISIFHDGSYTATLDLNGHHLSANGITIGTRGILLAGNGTVTNHGDLDASLGQFIARTSQYVQAGPGTVKLGLGQSLYDVDATAYPLTLASDVVIAHAYTYAGDALLNGFALTLLRPWLQTDMRRDGWLWLLVNGIDCSALFACNSVSITDDLNARNTLDLVLLNPAGIRRPDDGDPVELYDNGVMIFGGLVSDYDETTPPGTGALKTAVNCVDYNQLADRRLVAEVYENMTAGAIVRAIVTKYLAADGVTANGVQDGPVIPKITFNYVYASDAFSELFDRTGYAWNIDYERDLHFFGRETFRAPLALSDTSENFRALHVKRSLSDYRNRQYLRGGKALTAPRIESWKGDGENRTFTTAFPIGKAPTVTVASLAQTVGVKGVDTGKQWYWSKGTDTISQDAAAPVPLADTVVQVTYQGLYPIVISAKDDAQIADRAAREGTSGIYDAIADGRDTDDYDLALDRAMSYLRQKGLIQDVVLFDTDSPGLVAGQLISIDVTRHRLRGDYLIDSVSGSDMDGKFVRWNVRALSGERLGSWVDFFKKLAAARQSGILGTEATAEMEMLNLVQTMSDSTTVSDTLTATPETVETRAGTAVAGFSKAM